MIAIVCVAIVCGSALAGLVLWLRQQPTFAVSKQIITRGEWLATVEEIKRQKSLLETLKNALEVRKAFTPRAPQDSTKA